MIAERFPIIVLQLFKELNKIIKFCELLWTKAKLTIFKDSLFLFETVNISFSKDFD